MRRGTALAASIFPQLGHIYRGRYSGVVPKRSERLAFYLVSAVPKHGLMEELGERLAADAFIDMKPFGRALTYALRNARLRRDGVAVWEEEDYCRPPLAEERAAVLDAYFHDLRTEAVGEGLGWKKIDTLPPLFPELAEV
jgi:hypothetical protein